MSKCQNMNIINIDQLIYIAQEIMSENVEAYCADLIKEILEVSNS